MSNSSTEEVGPWIVGRSLRSRWRRSQAILSAVDARTGKVYWQERSIEKATFVWADQKLITLDQDGNLMIAHPSPQGFKISAKAPLLSNLSWTPPVLVARVCIFAIGAT